MSRHLIFFCPGIPPKATAQGKGVFMAGGKPRFFEKKAQKAAGATLHAMLLPHRPSKPFDGPLRVSVTFLLPWRKTEKKAIRVRGRYPVAVRPDLDNYFKKLGDVMSTLGFWHDDGQIADLHLAKAYSDEPGISISISEITP